MLPGRHRFWPLLLGLGLQTFAWNVCAPFLPLRIHELGTLDLGQVARQAGFLVGLSSLLNTTLATPWAWLGTRYGFRWQVMRAHTGTALGWTLMGLARTPLHLLGAASFLGGFSGNYPNYVALASLRAAPHQVGRAIGDLQAASQVGMTLGPLFGALVASQTGIHSTFFVSSALSMLGVLMAILFIPADSGRRVERTQSEGILAALKRPQQRWLMAIMLIGDAGVLGLRPLIPVFLSARIDDPAALAAATGVTTTLATGGTIAAAIVVGRLSQRVTPQSVLTVTLPLSALSVILVPFANSVPQLMILWALSGIASGATTPAVFAWLGRLSPAGTASGTAGYTLLANTSMATYAIGPILIGQASATNLDLPFYIAVFLYRFRCFPLPYSKGPGDASPAGVGVEPQRDRVWGRQPSGGITPLGRGHLPSREVPFSELMKIYMLWDMEGCSGLFTRPQAWYWDPGVPPETKEAGLQLLMADVNSATAAALDAGADEVIICDTHHGGNNIRIPEMLQDPRITYHGRSRAPAPEGQRGRWMPGLDETVDGFMCPGHHAMAGTPNAFMPHTSSLEWLDFRINNQSVGEIGLEACYAGHWNVPLVFVQGDVAGCREAESQFPGIITAPVKRAAADEWHATGLSPEEARRLTADRVAQAVDNLRSGYAPGPYKPTLPMTVTIRMATPQAAEKAAQRPTVTRLDDHTIQGIVPRQADVLKWLTGDGLD